ncbi:hypothetical protein Tco_1187942 [Tanacetum coccineum]
MEEETHSCDGAIFVGLRGVFERFTTEQSRVSTWLITYMTQLMDVSGQTYQPFDITLVGSKSQNKCLMKNRRRKKVELKDQLKQKCFPGDNPVILIGCTSLSSQTLYTAYRTALDTVYRRV